MEKELKQKCGCACHRDKFGLVHETLCCDNTHGSLEIREVNRIKAELEKAVREEIVKEARKRYKCGACDSKTSNLSHTMLCEFLQSLTLKQ
jgi:hypothetical protein